MLPFFNLSCNNKSIESSGENEMNKDEITALFDKQAAHYDSQWANTAPIRQCMYMLLESMFYELPEDANILCVGAGTGAELSFLAGKNPGWRFTACLLYTSPSPRDRG